MAHVPFPDVEAAVIEYLAEETSARVGPSTPGNLEEVPLFIRVQRGPGSDDGVTDAPALDVEAFAPRREDAHDLAQVARAALLNLAGRRVGQVLFDSVRTSLGPYWVDYRNPNVNRFVASYQLGFRAF